MFFSHRKIIIAILALGFGLSGCAESQFVAHTAKSVTRATKEPPVLTGEYKVGKPYQVAGAWYYPKVNYSYDETGIASWYGPGFHGKKTANGETYDQDGLTAAHRTLPMPSMVQVTNLENGRSIKVRINDRGPFKNGRIIDLSRGSAQLLGFIKNGTAKVRVEILESESRQLASLAQGFQTASAAVDAVPIETVTTEPLPAPDGTVSSVQPVVQISATSSVERQVIVPEADGIVTMTQVKPSNIFVQAGAFLQVANANRMRARLSGLGNARIALTKVGDQQFYRVRLGPMPTVEEADRLLAILIVNKIGGARVVVD